MCTSSLPPLSEERILQITNNINEGEPAGASKVQLMQCVQWWSLRCASEAERRVAAESELQTQRLLTALESSM